MEDVRRLARECELYRGLLRLNASSALEPFLRDALQLIVQLSGAEQAYLELFKPGESGADGDTRWSAAAGCTDSERDEIKASVSRGIITEALVSGETILTPSALLDPRFSELGSVKSSNIRAVLCAPIGKDPPMGVLYLQRRSMQDMFTAEDAACAELFAMHLAPLVHTLLDCQRFQDKDPTLRYRSTLKVEHLIGASKPMATLLREIGLVAPLDVCVLLTGDTGSGKTQVARTIHDNSARAQQPFVEVNCAAIPEALVESELFGALPGAHSTANRKIEGKVSAASGGTLFLDDVAELHTSAQAKLLQLLQTGQYYPLGASQPHSASVRVIAATHVNFEGRRRGAKVPRRSVLPLVRAAGAGSVAFGAQS
ncbi:MAG: sigma 54-interacting transcriptional regulator [Polyangiaceae bacterium]